jgi:hypothetical protein
VDLDGDGIKDVVSGSSPGEIYFFKGRTGSKFDAPVKLRNKDGKLINVGGGIQSNTDTQILVAGDASFEEKDGKCYIVYNDQRIEMKPNQQAGITGTRSAVCVADLNGDGKLDLIIGNSNGGVFCVLNEGDAKNWKFGNEQPLLANGQPVKAASSLSAPCRADWDGDGKPDLLVGEEDGSVSWYRNTGAFDPKTRLPVFAAGRVLVPKGNLGADSTEPTRGIRAKICVADWNGDGRPDLLLGDLSQQKAILSEPTAQQKAEYDKAQAQIKELQPKYDAAMQKYVDTRSNAKLTANERQKAEKEFIELSSQMSTLQAKLPRETETHGWVWLFTRKPAK